MDHTKLPESAIQDVPPSGWDGFPPDPNVEASHRLEYNGTISIWLWMPGIRKSLGYWTIPDVGISSFPHEMNQYHYKGVA